MEKNIYRAFEKKEGRNWIETFRTTDENQIYKDLSSELLYCRVFKSPRYHRMTQNNNYDGTRTIIFYTDYGRSIYRVAE